MSLYIVHKKNPFFANGLTIELFTQGFQECILEDIPGTHRTKVIGTTGLFMPEREVKPYCMKLLNRGLDKPMLRTRRTEYGH